MKSAATRVQPKTDERNSIFHGRPVTKPEVGKWNSGNTSSKQSEPVIITITGSIVFIVDEAGLFIRAKGGPEA
jgi:hypothetical protein